MKFRVKNNELAGKLALVARTLASGGVNPALGGILVEATDGRLSFSSTDSNISLRVPVHVEGQVESDGRVLLPGRLFADISRLLGSGEADIEYLASERLDGGDPTRLRFAVYVQDEWSIVDELVAVPGRIKRLETTISSVQDRALWPPRGGRALRSQVTAGWSCVRAIGW